MVEQYRLNILSSRFLLLLGAKDLSTDESEIDNKDVSEVNVPLVSEIILNTDRSFVRASEISEIAREEYSTHLSAHQSGLSLRLLGQEILEPNEYLTKFNWGGNKTQWYIGFIREDYSEEIKKLVSNDLPSHKFDPLYNSSREEVKSANNDVKEAYDKEHRDFEELSEISEETVAEFYRENKPDIDELNEYLYKKISQKPLQLSKVTKNQGGWAPDAFNPGKVDLDGKMVSGEIGILSQVTSSPSPDYKLLRYIE